MPDASPVLVVTGLSAEARVAGGPGCRVIAGGADRAGLERRLVALDGVPLRAIVSFGLAGGLAPDLPVGSVVLAADVVGPGMPRRTDKSAAGLAGTTASALRRTGLAVHEGSIAGVDAPAATPADKAALQVATGAIAVDMESHIASAYAARRRLPFLAIRVVSDGAQDVVPPAAALAMRPDGTVDIAGLLAALARDPRQIPGLIATARNAAVAFRRLRRVRGLLGRGFGLHL